MIKNKNIYKFKLKNNTWIGLLVRFLKVTSELINRILLVPTIYTSVIMLISFY